MSDTTCKNCGTSFKSHYKHCPECGQKANENLTLGVLFNNTISNYFSVDARFFKSFIPLMFKPGFLAKQFIGGKRLTYLHPAQFYLFISVVFFFIFSISVREQTNKFDSALQKDFDFDVVPEKDSVEVQKALDSLDIQNMLKPLEDKNIKVHLDKEQIEKLNQLDSVVKNPKGDSFQMTSFKFERKKIDSLITAKAPEADIYKAMGMPDDAGVFKRKLYAQILKFYKNRGGGILSAFYDTIPIAMFFLLPIFALILKLFFYKRGRYAHHLVFSFYYFSFLFMILSLIFILNYFFDVPGWIDFLVWFSTFLYLFFAVKRFYGKGWFESFIKSGFIAFIYMIFIIPVAAGIIGFVAFMFY